MVDQKVLDFLGKEMVAVLTVQLPFGAIHGATMHFVHQSEPLELYFITESSSRKVAGLKSGKTQAAVVVGFSDEEMATLQMDGELQVVTDPTKVGQIKPIYYHKHPMSVKYEAEPGNMYLVFIPAWWRFTDFKVQPLVIIENNK